MRRLALLLPLLAAGPASAHEADALASPTAWTWDAWITVPLVLSALLYGVGTFRLWRRAGAGRGLRAWQVGCFALGWVFLAGALVSPLHRLSEGLFFAHMTEHEILMAAAAPLLVLAQPFYAMPWAFPRPVGRALAGFGGRIAALVAWRSLVRPGPMTVVHGAVIWAWHMPVLFDAALENGAIHALQHASFLITALLFWAVLLPRPGQAYGNGSAVLHLFVTAGHTGLLGALLAVSRRPWYEGQDAFAAHWGLTPLTDQQLGGLIMWVPAGVVYALAALILFAVWLVRPRRAWEARNALP